MVDHHLRDLSTQHPGGWQDIIDFVNRNYSRYQASYVTVDASVTKSVVSSQKGDAHAEYSYRRSQQENQLPRLEEICHGISGIAASMGWEVLKSLGLPLPGSKDWLKPCSQWRANEKG